MHAVVRLKVEQKAVEIVGDVPLKDAKVPLTDAKVSPLKVMRVRKEREVPVAQNHHQRVPKAVSTILGMNLSYFYVFFSKIK